MWWSALPTECNRNSKTSTQSSSAVLSHWYYQMLGRAGWASLSVQQTAPLLSLTIDMLLIWIRNSDILGGICSCVDVNVLSRSSKNIPHLLSISSSRQHVIVAFMTASVGRATLSYNLYDKDSTVNHLLITGHHWNCALASLGTAWDPSPTENGKMFYHFSWWDFSHTSKASESWSRLRC